MVKSWLDLAATPNFENCVRVIYTEFVTHYRNSINDLTHHFPADARNKCRVTGADLGAFWHGHKRFPQAATFNPNDELHVQYVYAGANILAKIFHLPEQNCEQVLKIISTIPTNPWVYTGAKVDVDESKDKAGQEKKEEATPMELDDEERTIINQLTEQLTQIDVSKYQKLAPQEFEKDVNKQYKYIGVRWIFVKRFVVCILMFVLYLCFRMIVIIMLIF
jgi:ubiquitin-activating enzyme E1